MAEHEPPKPAGQKVGYLRVSTLDQKTDRQLVGIVLDRTFVDKASGKDTDRPQLREMLAYVRAGDAVVVHSMDRLARNLEDLRAIVRTLTQKAVSVQFIKEQITLSPERTSPLAELTLSLMGSFAEFERALILERQREGVALAKLKGVYKGRKRVLTPEQVAELQQKVAMGGKKATLAREMNVSRETIHRYLRANKATAPVLVPVKPTPAGPPQVKLKLLLELLPYNKRGTKPKKLIEDLEFFVLSRFSPVAVRPGVEYELTVRYDDVAQLEEQMDDLWREMTNLAEERRCDVQGEILDAHSQRWGIGNENRDPISIQN